jgi:hypothetical protein
MLQEEGISLLTKTPQVLINKGATDCNKKEPGGNSGLFSI